jgi:ferredoxin-NADP reductase
LKQPEIPIWLCMAQLITPSHDWVQEYPNEKTKAGALVPTECHILTDMRVLFDHADQEAPTLTTFWFKPEKPIDYTAGQFTELMLHHNDPDDRGKKRWFTLSSAPGHELVSITTKYAGDDNSSSFKKALFRLTPGSDLTMREPMGDFVLPKDRGQPLVLVAGGIGLTPFHSMLEWLADHDEDRNIRFIYAVRTEDEIIFQNTFARAGIHATIIVSEPSNAWGGERGQASAESVLGLAEPSDNTLIYLSGPEPMIESLTKSLQLAGFPRRQLVTDSFPGYKSIYK